MNIDTSLWFCLVTIDNIFKEMKLTIQYCKNFYVKQIRFLINNVHCVAVASETSADENVAMYVGLIVAIAVFVTVIVIIIFLLRRKGRQRGLYAFQCFFVCLFSFIAFVHFYT